MPVNETRNYVTQRMQTENGQNIVMPLEYANVKTDRPGPRHNQCSPPVWKRNIWYKRRETFENCEQRHNYRCMKCENVTSHGKDRGTSTRSRSEGETGASCNKCNLAYVTQRFFYN